MDNDNSNGRWPDSKMQNNSYLVVKIVLEAIKVVREGVSMSNAFVPDK